MLLADMVRVALAHRNERKAEEAFAEARKLALTHKLAKVLVDILVYVADYNWRENLKSKQDALRFYVMALVTALSRLPIDDFPVLASHIVTRLTNRHAAPSGEEFALLLDGLKRDIPVLTDTSKEWLAAVLWPFEAARRLLPFVEDEKRYLAELKKIAKKDGFP